MAMARSETDRSDIGSTGRRSRRSIISARRASAALIAERLIERAPVRPEERKAGKDERESDDERQRLRPA